MNTTTQQTEIDRESLMEMLGSTDGAVRQKARQALVAMGSSAVPGLIDALHSSMSDQVRWEAAASLGTLVDPRSIPVLVRALEDSESDVAWLAGEALCHFKKLAWAPLLHALVNTRGLSGTMRQGAHQVFVHQKEERFDEAIAQLLKALQPCAVPQATVIAAEELLALLKLAK